MVVLHSVLHDRQAKAGATGLFGMTLIDTIETLKYLVQMFGAMPMPVSLTLICTAPCCSATETFTWPPGLLYLIALSQRLYGYFDGEVPMEFWEALRILNAAHHQLHIIITYDQLLLRAEQLLGIVDEKDEFDELPFWQLDSNKHFLRYMVLLKEAVWGAAMKQ